jgi:hypothetical protein
MLHDRRRNRIVIARLHGIARRLAAGSRSITARVPLPWLRFTIMHDGSAIAAAIASSALRPSNRESPVLNTMPCSRP